MNTSTGRDLRCGECRHESWLRDGSGTATYLGQFIPSTSEAVIRVQHRRSGRQHGVDRDTVASLKAQGFNDPDVLAMYLKRSYLRDREVALDGRFDLKCRHGHHIGATVAWVIEQVEKQTTAAPIFLPKLNLDSQQGVQDASGQSL